VDVTKKLEFLSRVFVVVDNGCANHNILIEEIPHIVRPLYFLSIWAKTGKVDDIDNLITEQTITEQKRCILASYNFYVYRSI